VSCQRPHLIARYRIIYLDFCSSEVAGWDERGEEPGEMKTCIGIRLWKSISARSLAYAFSVC